MQGASLILFLLTPLLFAFFSSTIPPAFFFLFIASTESRDPVFQTTSIDASSTATNVTIIHVFRPDSSTFPIICHSNFTLNAHFTYSRCRWMSFNFFFKNPDYQQSSRFKSRPQISMRIDQSSTATPRWSFHLNCKWIPDNRYFLVHFNSNKKIPTFRVHTSVKIFPLRSK